MSTDYYAVLQLAPGSSQEEVHRAYRAMAMRHHPDRNASPEAAVTMAVINEAYAVLGESGRRRRYDGECLATNTAKSHAAGLPILAAARDAVVRQRWAVLRDEGSNLLLEKGRSKVRVTLMERVTNEGIRRLGRHWVEFVVVLTLEIESPLNLALNVAIVDVMHLQHCGASFPDEPTRELFGCFLKK